MKLTCALIFLTSNCVLATNFNEVGLPIITNYSQDDYNAHNQNWDILQAKNHLIYVANGNGLLEFDGETWTKYYTPNRSRIRDIESVGTKIYAGTVNDIGYFEADKQGIMSYHSLNKYIADEFLQYGEVWSVVALDKQIIFKTVDYFFIWNGKSIRVVKDKTKSRVKMIAFGDKVYIKLINDKSIYTLNLNADNILNKTDWLMPEKAQIRAIQQDADNKLIFFSGRFGIFKQNQNVLEQLENTFEKGTFVYAVMQSHDGLFYVATVNQGLYVLSTELIPIKNYHDFHGLGMNAITAVMSDAQNNIWLAGNNAISVMRAPAEISRYNKSINAYGYNLKMVQNKLSFIGQGLFQLQENKPHPLYPPKFDKVEGINYDMWDTLDYHNQIFLATNNGVSLVKIQDSRLIEEQSIIKKNLFTLDIVATDDFKHVFAATSAGLFHIQHSPDSEWQAKQVKGFDSEVNNLSIDDNFVWIGNSSAQLFRVEIDSLNSDALIVLKFDKTQGIGNNKVVPFNLSMGTVFATNDGVMQYSKDNTLKFVDGMPDIFTTANQDAHLLYEDNDDRLWYRIGSHSGFAEKSNSNKVWHINEDIFKYFPDRSIDAFVSKEKNILWFMQSDNSIYRMNVDKVQNLPQLAPLYIRKVQSLNNNQIIDTGIVTELNKSLGFKSNSLRISYAMAAYAIPAKVKYRTKLNGALQPQWSDWSDETYRDFTELRGNDYILEVQAKDGFGRVTESSRLSFKVSPPFHLSKIALSIYALLALSLLIFTAWLVQKWRTKKLQLHNVELATLVDKKTIEIQGHVAELEQQQELKTRFFTNISHELRTPLSLIILPLQKLIRSNQKSLDKESQELLTLSLKNANGMKQLVNQVLDVSRFEQKNMPITVQKNELIGFIEKVSLQFIDWAAENQQQIQVIIPDKKIELYFDRQMMEKIVSNLLSNAIKYSGVGTNITVSFFENKNNAGFVIKDNGVGIAKAQCQEVFERYFKSDKDLSEHDSSGIGLDFVKEMVDLHHGEIGLKSDTGHGCEFSLTFKLGSENFLTLRDQIEGQSENQNDEATEIQPSPKEHPEDTSVVMIVEDNTDLRTFVSQSLSTHYNVIQAINGVDALKTLTHELPDLIISDIMMPQMDGIEFLQKLREQEQFKTIPFMMLSSKSTQKDTQLGLQYGANDYLTKPFDMDELLLRVKNMINSRKLIRKQVQDQLKEIKQQDKVELSSFEKKLRNIVLDNISDSSFNVNSLAETFGLERTALFRKIKKELHITPSKFIQKIRLEVAKDLLEKDNTLVSEVAYASGFESLSYFSKTFKNTYGKAPSNIANHS